jgi:hypothetical protein
MQRRVMGCSNMCRRKRRYHLSDATVERQRNISLRFFGVLAEIRIEDLPMFPVYIEIVLNFSNLQPALSYIF